jgi:hypothetical protein
MRRTQAWILAVTLGFFSGCTRLYQTSHPLEGAAASKAASGPSAAAETSPSASIERAAFPAPMEYVVPAEAASERKIIRNAELVLELPAPAEGKRKIEALAESCGGFVASSESSNSDEGGQNVTITLVVRIPAVKFAAALEDIRKLGYKIKREKLTGQDVTEEYVDLEARLVAKKAVEAQFLEILRQARQVSETLEVAKALGEVRGEIEQLEGRRRFLENRIALSTFTLTLLAPAPLIGASGPGFFQGLKQAFGEGFDAALVVVLWIVRLALVLVPIIIVLLPALYLWRRFHRKSQSQIRPQEQK